MPRSLRFMALAALAHGALFAGRADANPPGATGPRACANPPYRVVVHSAPVEVVVIEGEGKGRCLRLLGHCKKKERAEGPPESYYVQVPVMIPAAAPPCAAPPACGTPPRGGYLQGAGSGENPSDVAGAGEDLRATINRLKTMRAQREAEIASIDAALATTTPRAAAKAGVADAGSNRNEIKDLGDKIDYLTALVDALAQDLRASDPGRQLPAFDELNGLRKSKP